MCGIAGIWGGTDGTEPVEAMLRQLVHRGPDARGLHRDASAVLGHRRLSIMDPEGGRQPIYSEDRSHAIVANGEIYNFRSLNEQIGGRHTLATTSDTETALHLYEDLGAGVVHALDGMFAFAVSDGQRFFAARDALGIKPLYYARPEGAFWFASEMAPLAAFAEDVREFPPGTCYDSETGFRTFYTVPDVPARPLDEAAAVSRIRQTLEKAVVKRLMSDVPLGAFLSGGLDSSLIVALARRNLGRPIHTFSVGLENSPDLQAARRVSRYVDTVHHEHILTVNEVLDALPAIIRALESYDRDLVRSAIPCYFTSRLAAQEVKVILTGEGADELFAGYSYYKDIDDPDEVLQRELRRSVASLHNVNLQRVDRLTMIHSIEGRVPFLDLEMIQLGQDIPAALKLRGTPPVEKWILRKAFEDLLPAEIVWRDKAQFDEGSGTVDLLQAALASAMTPADAEAYRAARPGAGLRCAEECHYHRIFTEVFDQPERITPNVARWADRPL
ncbi:MAG: asparagine synthase B [Lentisphaerae bacterium]|nr:asparagine synthase B [Lentisphaerota bacterium]